MSRRTAWKTCPCGRPFRAYKHDHCEECRSGTRRAAIARRRIGAEFTNRRAARVLAVAIAKGEAQ